MGGLSEALMKPIGEGLEKLGTKIPEMLRGSKEGSALDDYIGSKDSIFKIGGDDGEVVHNMYKQYQTYKAAFTDHLNKPLQDLSNQMANDKDLYKNLKPDADLMTIYNHAKSINHPIAQQGGAIDQILKNDPNAGGLNLKMLRFANTNQADLMASSKAFGPKMENLMPILMKAYDSGDSSKAMWADSLLNIISNETHDTKTIMTNRGKIPASETKAKIFSAFQTENRLRKLVGMKELPNIDISPTYKKIGSTEAQLHNLLHTVQLPFVALKHLSQVGNLSTAPNEALAKGLLQMNDQDFKDHFNASHILAYTQQDMLDKELRGRFGHIAKWTGSPTAGSLFYRSFHMPFFDAVRTWQLTLAASVGYHSAQMWAEQATRDVPRALLELKEMGLDPDMIKAQGGKLTDEQLQHSMYHFVNNRFFMDKSIERALHSNENWFMRSATMYHQFVNAQMRFFQRELTKMMKAGDYVGIAKFAGTIGVLYPAVAPMLKSLEVFGHTLSPSKATQSVEEDYKNLLEPSSFKDFSGEYISLLAHYGSFGVYTSYLAAARGNRMLYALAGPLIGTGARILVDGAQGAMVENSLGKHNFTPLGRDILQSGVPIIGSIASHQLLPTRAEQEGERPHRKRRIRRERYEPPLEF